MKTCWELDEQTVVVANFGLFGRRTVSVNGKKVIRKLSWGRKFQADFRLPDGRRAHLSTRPRSFSAPVVELRVGDRRFVPKSKQALTCSGCGAAFKTYDRFCQGCGKATPTAEEVEYRANVAGASKTIKVLAFLFLVFGLIAFFLTQGQTADALQKLSGLDAKAPYQMDGRELTVGQVREQLQWAPWGVLITNLVLAAVMAGLALWGKRSPLPALLVATAVYAVVQVAAAIMDPSTLAGGIIVKIAVVIFLVRGIKSALALRGMEA